MLPPLCRVMAAIPSVSRFPAPAAGGLGGQMRRVLGFRTASWQHRSLDCGTLNLNDRCGGGFTPHRWRAAARRQEGGVAGSAVAGRSRQWQAPAW
jgi:hypothetical protein